MSKNKDKDTAVVCEADGYRSDCPKCGMTVSHDGDTGTVTCGECKHTYEVKP